jgi:hypothetical protein
MRLILSLATLHITIAYARIQVNVSDISYKSKGSITIGRIIEWKGMEWSNRSKWH